jgi:hypothetical protein
MGWWDAQEELMTLLGMRMKHLVLMLLACFALGTTMIACGDDDEPSDGGQDAEAGTGGGGKGGTGG